MRTDVWGIDAGYEDARGVWQPTPPDREVKTPRARESEQEEPWHRGED